MLAIVWLWPALKILSWWRDQFHSAAKERLSAESENAKGLKLPFKRILPQEDDSATNQPS